MDRPPLGRAAPQQARSREKYQRVLDAADQMFAEQGVRGAKMTALAATAGMSVGSLYQFFKDRDDVAAALADRYVGQLVSEFEELGLADLADLELAISYLVHHFLDTYRRHPGYRALVVEYSHHDPNSPLYPMRHREVTRAVEVLQPLLPDATPEFVGTVIGNGYEIGSHFLVRVPEHPDEADIEEVELMIMHYICGRLRPATPVHWPRTT